MPRGRNDSSSSYDTLESQTEDGFSSQGDEVDHEGANQANSRVTDFNARQRRIDQKQVTLELDKSSKDLYFSKLIKDGEISKEGRDALRDKYYLSPKMYEAWQPPQLEDTKLYFLAPKKNRDSVDAGLLSIHGRSLFRQIEHYLKSIFLAGSEKRPRSALPHWSISPAPRTWTTSLLPMTSKTHRCVKDQR